MSHYTQDIMQELDRTEELLHKGLKEINDKGELNASSLDVLGDTLDGIKDLFEIKGKGVQMIDEYGHSGRMPMSDYGNSYGGYSYDNSYARRANNPYGRNQYSYGRDYSRDTYMDDLRRRMDSAKTEQEREILRNMMNR